MKHMSYKLRLTDRTIEEEVLLDHRQISEARVNLGTIEPVTIARNPDISKSTVAPSKLETKRLKELTTRATDKRRSITSALHPKY